MGYSIPFLKACARVMVASAWYDTHGLTKRQRLYCKARELISGDRAERAAIGEDKRND